MQLPAHFPEVVQALAQHAVFFRGKETVVDQGFQAVGIEVAFGDPGDHLHIAQATRGVFQVGFEIVFGVIETLVASGLFFPLGGEKGGGVPHVFRAGAVFQLPAQDVVSRQGARFHDVGGHGDVFPRQLHALVQGAHRMADFQAHIPQKGHESLKAVAQRLFRGVGEQHQQIHIGAGVQFPAAVAAHGNQRHIIPFGQAKQGPGGNHHLIHHGRPGLDQLGNVGGFKRLVQAFLPLSQILSGVLAGLGAFLQSVEQGVLRYCG